MISGHGHTYIPVSVLSSIARSFRLTGLSYNVLFPFFLVIPSKMQRASCVTHEPKTGGLIAGDPGASGGFDLAQAESEAAYDDGCKSGTERVR